MHHIVADGWSFRILFDELSADYEAISRGGEPAAEEPPIQYADFAIWQIEQAEDGGYAPGGTVLAGRAGRCPAGAAAADRPSRTRPARRSPPQSITTTLDAEPGRRAQGARRPARDDAVRRPARRVRGRARPADRQRRPADRGADGGPDPAGDRVGRRAVHEHRPDPDPGRPGRDAARPGALGPRRDRAGAGAPGAAVRPDGGTGPARPRSGPAAAGPGDVRDGGVVGRPGPGRAGLAPGAGGERHRQVRARADGHRRAGRTAGAGQLQPRPVRRGHRSPRGRRLHGDPAQPARQPRPGVADAEIMSPELLALVTTHLARRRPGRRPGRDRAGPAVGGVRRRLRRRRRHRRRADRRRRARAGRQITAALRGHGVGRGRPGRDPAARAAPGCCRRSSASGPPARRTSRWTRSIRRSGWPRCSPTRARPRS